MVLLHGSFTSSLIFRSRKEWMVVKYKKKSKAMKSTEIIAIDCEMVLCEDGTEALVKVCAVDHHLKVSTPNTIVQYISKKTWLKILSVRHQFISCLCACLLKFNSFFLNLRLNLIKL